MQDRTGPAGGRGSMGTEKTVGYAAGVFDVFHTGHLNLLKRAKEQCDILIVAVTVDELVSYKKKKALIPFVERIEIVRAIRYVDEAVPQETMDKTEAWKKYRFNRIFVGTDWKGTETWNKWEKEFEPLGVEVVYIESIGPRSTELRKALSERILDRN